jgi:hypothetical protein
MAAVDVRGGARVNDFERVLQRFPPATRRTDPATSWEAERGITRSGDRLTQAERVLYEVRTHPGQTAAEIGVAVHLGHVPAQRRLSDLRNQGLIRQGEPRECAVKHTRMVTWHPFEPGVRQGVLL